MRTASRLLMLARLYVAWRRSGLLQNLALLGIGALGGAGVCLLLTSARSGGPGALGKNAPELPESEARAATASQGSSHGPAFMTENDEA